MNPGDADLDARIAQVEQRLIAREATLRQGAARLGRDVRHRLRPHRLLVPVGTGLLAVVAVWTLWRRPAPSTDTAAAPSRRLPWMQWLGLALPFLPAHWRSRLGPGGIPSLVTLGLPLVEALLRRRHAEPLETVAEVDLARLSGRWFLVGELPASDAALQEPPEFGLLPRDDGDFDLLQRRGTQGSEARVQVLPDSHGARLRISQWPELLRWLPLAWTEQGVMYVGPDYDEVLIGSAARDSLWLLSRRPTFQPGRLQALVRLARDRGFDVDKLRIHEAR